MDWGELKAAVPFRLNRPDLPADFVLEMLTERVDYYGPQVLVGAEQTNYSIVTQPGQFFYQLPRGTQRITYVRCLYNSIWIPIPEADTYTDILASDPLQPPFTSLPVSMYKVYGNQIRLFPTPNQQYPLELTGMFTIVEPTQDTDNTNFWVTDGRILLINSTCLEICSEYLDIALANSPRIATFEKNTERALDKLMTQAHGYSGVSVIRQRL
jgi:hypothetical protein